jgi:hypothetical protein
LRKRARLTPCNIGSDLAETVCAKFLRPGAPSEVTVSEDVRADIERLMSAAEGSLPSNLFDSAQQGAMLAIKHDAFPRFLKSFHFRAVAALARRIDSLAGEKS